MSRSLVPTSPPSKPQDPLEQKAKDQRARLESTLDKLKSRIGDQRAKVDDMQDNLQNVDDTVRRLRWPLIGAALVVGGLIGRKRLPPPPQVYLLPAGDEAAIPRPKPSLFRTAFTAVATQLARRALSSWLDGKQGQ